MAVGSYKQLMMNVNACEKTASSVVDYVKDAKIIIKNIISLV